MQSPLFLNKNKKKVPVGYTNKCKSFYVSSKTLLNSFSFSHGQWLKRYGDYTVEKSSSAMVGVSSAIQQVWTITNQSSPRRKVSLLVARYGDGSISFQ